jgi:hypothetical protein
MVSAPASAVGRPHVSRIGARHVKHAGTVEGGEIGTDLAQRPTLGVQVGCT